jgi:2-polyprenyl-6-methoxyphenol hydroxylase-like FAD-dependent oxidoreductase
MYHSLCDTDVFVAGGGPAGLATAIAARRAGFAVTLADVAYPPIDKTCGEGIMPDGLAALAKLGIVLPGDQTFPFHGIRFSDPHSSVEAGFPQGRGLAIRRTRLHKVLVDHATALGVVMHWGTRVTGITPDGVSVNGHNIRCRWLVGADGQNSRVRRWAGLEPATPGSRRFGFRCHYRVIPWSDYVEVCWTDRGQLYLTPVGGDEVCLALITHEPHTRVDDALATFPAIMENLRGAELVTREQGAISRTLAFPAVYKGSLALVGEASGPVDAITGDGLSMAFQHAEALVHALQQKDLTLYHTAHRKIARLPRMMSALMLFMDKNPWFRRRALRALSVDPSLFARMLAIHTGALSPLAFGLQGTLTLGWHLITA